MTARAQTTAVAMLTLAATALAFGVGVAGESPVTLLGSTAAPKDAVTERYYVALPGGDDDRLSAIFHRLDAAGARDIHAFLPDLIVCEVPTTVDARTIARDPGAVVARADEAARKLGRFDLRMRPATIEKAYARIKFSREQQKSDVAPPVTLQPYASEARPIPREAMIESARRVGARQSSPSGVSTTSEPRLLHQNSELLIGNILLNIILPESDIPNPYWYLNWTQDAIDQVNLGFFYAMQNYMNDFANADIGAIYKYHIQVPITTEPIRHTPANDKFWITLCLNELGYPGTESQVLNNVHEFNDDLRSRLGADWALAAFIATSEGNWLGPYFDESRYLSWSYVGGPYYVTSYPAGHLEWAEGQTLIARHEIGHIFWGLEEDVGPVSGCADRSGYMDIINGNKVRAYDPIFGDRRGCGDHDPGPCMMNQLDQIWNGWDPGPCSFSAQMWGVADRNENTVPDALDQGPVIEFMSAEIETVLAQVDYFDVRVRAVPIPNINPRQPAELRRDYAARIRDVDVAVGGLIPYTLEPSEIGSDGYVAEFRIGLPPFIPGRLRIDVGSRNVFYAKSPNRIKEYRYVHLKYLGFEIEHPNEGVKLNWTMLGELYDAHFALHRRNEDTGEEIIVVDGIQASGPTESGITPFEAIDDNTEPGVRYTYWVSGTIDLPNSAGTIHKVVESKPFEVQGAVARTRTPSSLISNVAPNPFTQRTWISMDIPHPDPHAPDDGSTAAAEAVLPVKVSVYDVRGRLVGVLVDRNVIEDVFTVSWDGTDDRGRPMPSGVYFMRVEVAGRIENRKVMLVR